MPYDVALSSTGEVYVWIRATTASGFDQDGNYLRTWEAGKRREIQHADRPCFHQNRFATGHGQRQSPDSAIQSEDDSEGDLEAVFGSFGGAPGQLNKPNGLAAIGADRVLVADRLNNRLQQFRAVSQAERAKAIIVAGGGPITGNSLWDATRLCANFAYRALLFSGYTRDDIYYLSADSGVDLDGDGELNDVDSDSTLAALENALTTWAVDGGVDMLTVYLVDHGGENTFRMSATEILGADTFHMAEHGTSIRRRHPARHQRRRHSGSFIRADEKRTGRLLW